MTAGQEMDHRYALALVCRVQYYSLSLVSLIIMRRHNLININALHIRAMLVAGGYVPCHPSCLAIPLLVGHTSRGWSLAESLQIYGLVVKCVLLCQFCTRS